MHKGKLVFAQLNEHLPKPIFRDCVKRYAGRYPTLSFSHWDQLLCMMFAQLTARTSLRDIELCLGSHSRKLYHAGFRSQVARSTLADANERRDCRIFEDFAMHLIGVARSLYGQDAFGLDLDQSVYAIDSTTIDLCLSLFDWAPATKGRAGVKVHTLLDLRGNIPAFIQITGDLTHYCPEISGKRQNWASGSPVSSFSSSAPSSSANGLTSNKDKLRTCKMACMDPSSASLFLTMATTT